MSLYVTDREIIRRLGIPKATGYRLLSLLTRRTSFPQKDAAFGKRRYWPAVVQWLNNRHGVKGYEWSDEHATAETECIASAWPELQGEGDKLEPVLDRENGRHPKGISPLDRAIMARNRGRAPN